MVILAVGQVVAFFEFLILDGGDANDGKKVKGVKNTPTLVGRDSFEVGIGDILFTGNRGTRSCVAADFAKGCMLIKTVIVAWRRLRAISGWRVSWAGGDDNVCWPRGNVAIATDRWGWGGRAVGGRGRGWRAVQAHGWSDDVEIGVKKLKAKVGRVASAPATAAWRLTAAAGDLVEIRI